ncbi:hypothetical protein NCC49_005692 [Naganishia albida]|nr:hypothetical protein NCC49_005692 [Naganishia albida]
MTDTHYQLLPEAHQPESANNHDGTPANGYPAMYDPSAFGQTAFGRGGYQSGQNGQGRNRGGRDGGRNRNGGFSAQQHHQQHVYPPAFAQQQFPMPPYQSAPPEQLPGMETPSVDGEQSETSANHQHHGPGAGFGGQGYAMSGVGLPGMSPMMTGSPHTAPSAQGGPFPHPVPGIGIYPYSHLGYGGKLPGVNGNPGRLPGTLPNGSMDPAQMTGNYGPAAAAAAAAAAGNTTGRTVYVGNLPADASVDELMNLVRFGPVESVRLLPEKSCVFISFLDGATAAAFHADATVKKLTLHGQELKIGWGHASVVPSQVVHAIAMSKATRNVYLGGLDETVTESQLRDDLSRFGPIDQVKIVRDKSIGFVHFLSITVAMKVVNTLPQEPAWQGKRIGYGKDRCAYVPRAQQAAVQAAQQQAAAALSHTLGIPGGPFPTFNPLSPAALYSADFSNPAFAQSGMWNAIVAGAAAGGPSNGMVGQAGEFGHGGFAAPAVNGGHPTNRCLYIGNLPEDATTSDICEGIRGGLLLSIKYIPEKHYAFVTFVDPIQATYFYHQATSYGLMIKHKKVKVSWGRGNNFVHPSVLNAVMVGGATRIVYIGGVEDFDAYNEQRLRDDFGTFGEIEQINFLKDKKAAFVNFCDVRHASKALDALKVTPEYEHMRLAYGKDRCAGNPRPGHFGFTPRSRGHGHTDHSTANGSSTAPTPNTREDGSANETAEDPHASNSATIASDSQGDLQFPNILRGLEKELAGVTVSDTGDSGIVGLESDPVGRNGQESEKNA